MSQQKSNQRKWGRQSLQPVKGGAQILWRKTHGMLEAANCVPTPLKYQGENILVPWL